MAQPGGTYEDQGRDPRGSRDARRRFVEIEKMQQRIATMFASSLGCAFQL